MEVCRSGCTSLSTAGTVDDTSLRQINKVQTGNTAKPFAWCSARKPGSFRLSKDCRRPGRGFRVRRVRHSTYSYPHWLQREKCGLGALSKRCGSICLARKTDESPEARQAPFAPSAPFGRPRRKRHLVPDSEEAEANRRNTCGNTRPSVLRARGPWA